jgi:hypothetical protein
MVPEEQPKEELVHQEETRQRRWPLRARAGMFQLKRAAPPLPPRRISMPLTRVLCLCLLLSTTLGAIAFTGEGRSMQQAPAEVAREYLDAVEGMWWQGVVAHIHPAASEAFRSYVEAVLFPRSDPDDVMGRPSPETEPPRPEVLERLMGVETVGAFLAMTDDEVLLQAFRVLEEDSPGLINAWVARSTQVLGTILEGDTLAHVAYRLQWELRGATADTELLTLATSTGGEWKVLESRELGSIRPALGSVLRRIRSGDP